MLRLVCFRRLYALYFPSIVDGNINKFFSKPIDSFPDWVSTNVNPDNCQLLSKFSTIGHCEQNTEDQYITIEVVDADFEEMYNA